MRRLDTDLIIKATGGRLIFGKKTGFSGVSIDSRSIKPGELFVAIKGDRFDGHDFVCDALVEGSGAMVSIPPSTPVNGKTLIYVKNTTTALHDTARHMRAAMPVPVFGIVGTNGKTTTKEMTASVLGTRHKVLKTAGNLNNHIGLPLSIMRMSADETVMTLEMGSNAEGDIRLLCDIARPDYAIVTNVGRAHLEGFGNIETVRKTDLEILGYARKIFVNSDDPFLMDGLTEYAGEIVRYGIENPAEVFAEDITGGERGSSFTLRLPGGKSARITLNLPGRFNILNALAAAAAGHEMGLSAEEISAGLAAFTGVAMRLEIFERNGALVIGDVYNSNPDSAEASIRELVRLKRKRTVAVLGDMRELGAYAEEAHNGIVRMLGELGVDMLIATGPLTSASSGLFRGVVLKATDSAEAAKLLLENLREGDTVLIKGSRGMKMEKVSGALKAASEEAKEKENVL